MRTNLEKWNYYREIIRKKDENYVESNITIIPKVMYDVYPRSGVIRELIVTEIYYYRYINIKGKKPTKIEVAEVKKIRIEKNLK